MVASSISGISVTNDNYLTVVALLKEKFGKKEAIVEALYSQLQTQLIAQNQLSEVKSTYDAIEKILRQLESQNEDINQPTENHCTTDIAEISYGCRY